MLRAWCQYRNMEYVPDFVNPLPSENFESGFKQGTEWLIAQPLADRLTDEEKEKIRVIYNNEVDAMVLETRRLKDSQSPIDTLSHESNWWQAKLKADLLEEIFGKELFNQPPEV